jgi:aminoglycoside 3-N-acetyltransferase I
MTTIRTLSGEDVDVLEALMEVFATAFEDPVTYQSRVPTDAYLSRLLAKEHFIAVVALAEGRVIGGLTAYQLDKFEQDRREIYIYDLAVLEQHRRKGVATALIAELKRVAAEHDVYVIFVQADRVDVPAIALYEKLGNREMVYHFDIEVPKPTTGPATAREDRA